LGVSTNQKNNPGVIKNQTAVMMKAARMRWLGNVIRMDEAVIIK
jgi:hypothetical protein